MNKAVVFAAAATVGLSGCAAMFNGTSQEIAVRSHDDSAKIYINDAYMGKGNIRTTFHKDKEYTIRVEAKECTPTEVKANKSFDPTTLLGVFVDYGIFSILIIDGVATGSWQKFDQESYVINAQCDEV